MFDDRGCSGSAGNERLQQLTRSAAYRRNGMNDAD
jgi:hypothetical protein